MDLILWRHAEAAEGAPDATRRLTKKGEKQAAKIAAWLQARVKNPPRLMVSPATRAQQTAMAFGADFETVQEIGADSSAPRILRATGWPNAEGIVVVVGHQPTLGRLAALLLAGQEADWEIEKGGLWWFQTQKNGAPPLLRAVITAKHV